MSTLFVSHRLTHLDNHAPLELLLHESKFYKTHGTIKASLTFSHKSINP